MAEREVVAVAGASGGVGQAGARELRSPERADDRRYCGAPRDAPALPS
jgi:hypothetical protein